MIRYYDQWKTATPRDIEIVVYECEHCGGEIYKGEECLDTAEGIIHEDCFNHFAEDILRVEVIVAGEDFDE